MSHYLLAPLFFFFFLRVSNPVYRLSLLLSSTSSVSLLVLMDFDFKNWILDFCLIPTWISHVFGLTSCVCFFSNDFALLNVTLCPLLFSAPECLCYPEVLVIYCQYLNRLNLMAPVSKGL